MDLIELTTPASLEKVQLGVIAVRNIAAAYYQIVTGRVPGEENAFLDAVELAAGEACTNAVKYCPANNRDDHRLHVCFALEEDQLVVMIKDRNAAFDFAAVMPPNFAETPESGYGIYLMKETMDEVTYQRKDGWNIVKLIKRIGAGE
jgi:anti-sigma regulatory factor (Ser/Thr protein kinase)